MVLNKLKILALLVLTAGVTHAQTTINGGSVKGTWTKANSPYKITSSINIDAGDTLKIEPGVTVHFSNKTGVYVRGSLKANGAIRDSITFTIDPISNYHTLWKNGSFGWRGFCFLGNLPDSDTTEFSYCKFSYVNKLDTTGCSFIDVWTGYKSDSTRFIVEGLSLTCFAHRFLKVQNCRFYNHTGSGPVINLNRGGIKMIECTMHSILESNPSLISAPNVACIFLNQLSTFPNPTKYYSSTFNDNQYHSIKGPLFWIRTNKKTIMKNNTFSALSSNVINGLRLFGIGAIQSETDIDSLIVDGFNDTIDYSSANQGNFKLEGLINARNIQIKNIIVQTPSAITSYRPYDFIVYSGRDESIIENLSVTNCSLGYHINYPSNERGFSSVLSIRDNSKLKLVNPQILNSHDGIVIYDSELSVQNGKFSNCQSGINVGERGKLRASNILIANNSSYGLTMGSDLVGAKSRVYISNSIITGNRGDNWPTGGQVSYTDQSFLTLKNCIVENGVQGFKFTDF